MQAYTNPDPKFYDHILIYEETDPVDAETVDNVPIMQLLDNDLVLKNSIKNVFALLDQTLAAVILNFERLSKMLAFEYDGAGEMISCMTGCIYDNETIYLPVDRASYKADVNEEIVLQAAQDIPFGTDGYLYTATGSTIVAPQNTKVNDETIILDGAKYITDTIILPTSSEGIKDIASSTDIISIATLAADMAEERMSSPERDFTNSDVNYIVGA